jgi:hypothetical protein
MSPAQIALFGAIAGFTIYIGLPHRVLTVEASGAARPPYTAV